MWGTLKVKKFSLPLVAKILRHTKNIALKRSFTAFYFKIMLYTG